MTHLGFIGLSPSCLSFPGSSQDWRNHNCMPPHPHGAAKISRLPRSKAKSMLHSSNPIVWYLEGQGHGWKPCPPAAPRSHTIPAAAQCPVVTGTAWGQCPAPQPTGWGAASLRCMGTPNLWGQPPCSGAGELLAEAKPAGAAFSPPSRTHPLHPTSPTQGTSS